MATNGTDMNSKEDETLLINNRPGVYLEASKSLSNRRLLACIANEDLAIAHYIQNQDESKYAIFTPKNQHIANDSAFLVELRHRPITLEAAEIVKELLRIFPQQLTSVQNIEKIGLLHPDDIGTTVYYRRNQDANRNESLENGLLELANHPSRILCKVLEWNDIDQSLPPFLLPQLELSILNQAETYRNPPLLPKIGISSNLDWEQSLLEGHPTHPLHKNIFTLPPLKPINPGADLFNPKIHFYSYPRYLVSLKGEFEELLESVLPQGLYDKKTEVVIPVHELQIPKVEALYPFARKLDLCLQARATASLRTVILEQLPHLNIKLPLAVFVTSVERTVSEKEIAGAMILKDVLPKVINPLELLLAREIGSAIVKDVDEERSSNFSCMIREDAEYIVKTSIDPLNSADTVLIVSALTQRLPNGGFVVTCVLELDSYEQRRDFLEGYINSFIDAFYPPYINYGVGFEAHGQNTLVKLRRVLESASTSSPWKVSGFVARDFDGVRIHREKFESTTGIKWSDSEYPYFLPEGKGIRQFYHDTIQINLQCMIRALGFHYNGEGWEMVRNKLRKILLPGSALWKYMLESPLVEHACFLRMKIDGNRWKRYRSQVQNIVLFQGTEKNRKL